MISQRHYYLSNRTYNDRPKKVDDRTYCRSSLRFRTFLIPARVFSFLDFHTHTQRHTLSIFTYCYRLSWLIWRVSFPLSASASRKLSMGFPVEWGCCYKAKKCWRMITCEEKFLLIWMRLKYLVAVVFVHCGEASAWVWVSQANCYGNICIAALENIIPWAWASREDKFVLV